MTKSAGVPPMVLLAVVLALAVTPGALAANCPTPWCVVGNDGSCSNQKYGTCQEQFNITTTQTIHMSNGMYNMMPIDIMEMNVTAGSCAPTTGSYQCLCSEGFFRNCTRPAKICFSSSSSSSS
eukprot:CAMPEP_0172082008 /NCGR_PEP_ID=MMETSP1043-20130122/19617_1 /TAXON_ID=464988 /ORGANISM="Hemiselmis andersenii, Strain CCMP441" /LENGTH=122 /DNA_ID=CAMNT_0012743509 /DNA_START=95 /DNA_END=459 /DNA_ORIENTATION=-